MSEPRLTRSNLEHGFSLLEVLITVVVVSIGLLGLAGLQFQGLRAANGALNHTQAVLLIQDINERIRANPGSSYGGISLDGSSTATAVACDAGNDCDSASMLLYDQYQWIQMIDKPLLPNLTIAIAHSGASPSDVYTATLTWGNSDNLQTLSASFSPSPSP
jgi:type IV pilus assembly protein PilV